jgi:hypothetical protein
MRVACAAVALAAWLLPGVAAAQAVACAGGGSVQVLNWRTEENRSAIGTTTRYYVDIRHGGGTMPVNWLIAVRRPSNLMITSDPSPAGGQLAGGASVTVHLASFFRHRDGSPHATPGLPTLQSLVSLSCAPPQARR